MVLPAAAGGRTTPVPPCPLLASGFDGCRGASWPLTLPGAAEPRLVEHVLNPHHGGRRDNEPRMHASQLDPGAVGTFVEAVEGGAAGGVGLESVRRQLLARHFRVV